ncbi:adenylate/guanylate cyclase domain-containing protein [Thermospira aquatica]|uniref:Adenylate/guanylate cyclase domain-containing protein n=1 Tax=Thermospira aquatica TaxID=2828656 RepID=A0AAX3BDC9_9SPIR|nr:adenylate/guanylate cyclase domain-containing protein [Thermospira aquatica]URA10280.1 adenylate/guanylate cyclase domain-containing protein [Thermospira aquatica]
MKRQKKQKAVFRKKIVFVMLPLLILTVVFVGFMAYYTARNGVTAIAKEFLGYKVMDIYKYTTRQFSLAKEIQLIDKESLYESLYSYGLGTLSGAKGGFFILSRDGQKIRSSVDMMPEEFTSLYTKLVEKEGGWIEFKAKGKDYVGVGIYFSDAEIFLLLANEREEFYRPVNAILWYIGVILVISVVIATVVMLSYVRHLMKPVGHLVETIESISETRDLSKRARVEYNDEIGYLAYAFNTMVRDLELAYHQIKNYAYQTIQAKNKEEKIRFIFQKYVPTEVINRILNISSETMLIGTKQEVTVLFSDIRDFTHISEQFAPDFLVTVLNQYFSIMDERIRQHNGIIDKYIGDAIMAIFGAPVQHEDDVDQALQAAFAMQEGLKVFNAMAEEKYGITFKIGIGINTGEAIVGNIGSENKVDYTVIGDTVNLASRLEGLTKKYKASLVISEFTRAALKSQEGYFFRLLDFVRVKGKDKPVRIYQPFVLSEVEDRIEYFTRFEEGLRRYLAGDFTGGLAVFQECVKQDPQDYLAYMYIERCEYYHANPPSVWDGAETLLEK